MYKLLIFDLDGVLVDTNTMHRDALADAINEISPEIMSKETQDVIGLPIPTTAKLRQLGVAPEMSEKIANRKQQITQERIQSLKPDLELVSLLELLSKKYSICVASNSHSSNVRAILSKIGLTRYVDLFLGNDSVQNHKPHPEMIIRCMLDAGVLPSETVLFEDSDTGAEAGKSAGCNVVRVLNPKDLIKKIGKEYVY